MVLWYLEKKQIQNTKRKKNLKTIIFRHSKNVEIKNKKQKLKTVIDF